MRKASVTLYDIARRAKVSHMTVANALNRRERDKQLSKQKAVRIRALARQMGYIPHTAARSLASGKTYTVILITRQGWRNSYALELIERLQNELRLHQYHLNLEMTLQPKEEESVFRNLSRGRCDGVLVYMHELPQARLENITRMSMPVVAITPTADAPFDCVYYDMAESARLATEHLLAQGHRRVAFVVSVFKGLPSSLHLQGYRKALEKAGVDFDRALIFPWKVTDKPSDLWQVIKTSRMNPTGIICYNDQLAAGFLHAVRMEGCRVPEDLALVALGNSWILESSEVPLTAVDTNPMEISKVAVAHLIERIARPETPTRHTLVEPKLVVRTSSYRILPAAQPHT